MLIYFLQGATLSVSAALMPGPFQAFLLSQSLTHGWRRTLPAAFAPLVTDGPIIALVLFVLTQTPQWFLDLLRVAGGIFILYLAKGALSGLKGSGPVIGAVADAGRRTFLSAILMNFLNPNPYIFWSVVSGPIVLSGWRRSPGFGIAFLVGFYGAFVCCLMALIILFGTAGSISDKVNRALIFVAAAALLAFGLYQVAVGSAALIP